MLAKHCKQSGSLAAANINSQQKPDSTVLLFPIQHTDAEPRYESGSQIDPPVELLSQPVSDTVWCPNGELTPLMSDPFPWLLIQFQLLLSRR